ncbi:MAG: glycosyltransferase [Acidobacteria bacterium]|nr:glycosyltransferase [Acidobacteriota bacterium]MCB9397016.1 glycosyltransferase [Acidobacteriota bacterium]
MQVIIPVYKGFEETKRCLQQVLSAQNKTSFQLKIINDASPDTRITNYLRELEANGALSLVENKKNLGFVASVNLGLRLAQEGDIVLLNSDTVVFDHWLDQLIACADQDAWIGTVTPFSNNATICSFPVFCADNPISIKQAQQFHELAQSMSLNSPIELPTAVGFCMLIRRQCLLAVGVLDEAAFGPGYGEENDFCMRAANLGWKNVLCGNCFVYHQGSVSFGESQKHLAKKALETLNRIHPEYLPLVNDFLLRDPIKPLRKQLTDAFFQTQKKPIVLMATQREGGGVQQHIQELVDYFKEKAVFLLLQPIAEESVELYWQPYGLSLGVYRTDDSQALEELLRQLPIIKVHIQHTRGWALHWLNWIKDLGYPIEYTLHDYFALTGNPKLTDRNHRFLADPQTWSATLPNELPPHISLTRFKQTQMELLNKSQRVNCPSRSLLNTYKQILPNCAYILTPHLDYELAAPYPDPQPRQPIQTEQPLRIAVLGALGPEKGADLLEQTARMASQEQFKFHLIGYAYRRLNRIISQTGPYAQAELKSLIQAYEPHVIWFPCQWPESYSYTLSTALELGLPIVAPMIGAFPERLEGRSQTWLLDWDLNPNLVISSLKTIRKELNQKQWPEWIQSRPTNYYSNHYLNLIGSPAAKEEKMQPRINLNEEHVFDFEKRPSE